MIAEAICAAIFALYPKADGEEPRRECVMVAQMAEVFPIEPVELVGLGYEESKFRRRATSPKGARGPLQVTEGVCDRWDAAGRPGERPDHPYWQGCDLVASGAWEWTRLRKERGHRIPAAACYYNAGGKCRVSSKAQKWGRVVERTIARLRAVVS